MHPSLLSIHEFQYELPEDYIAKFPLEERDASRLLVFKDNNISEDVYRNLPEYLPDNAMLVFNNSRVIEARIVFQKPTGALIEVFALEPADNELTITTDAMKLQGEVKWKCLIGGASKWKHGQRLSKIISGEDGIYRLEAAISGRLDSSFIVTFNWQPAHLDFAEILHKAGQMPVPPYLKRETTETDKERYQTIFASEDGSVAAPTAGLHFTDSLLNALRQKNITIGQVTLHVGAGTFMPVKAARMKEHAMHAEFIEADISFIRLLSDNAGKIFPVGTTSLRTIESLYWMGVKCLINPDISYEALEISQWEVYDELINYKLETASVLEALAGWMVKRSTDKLIIRTRILIAPGYNFKLTAGLVTNFHQPQSTLLLLVAALTGNRWRDIYDYALRHQFRFLSYGDGCLLYPVR